MATQFVGNLDHEQHTPARWRQLLLRGWQISPVTLVLWMISSAIVPLALLGVFIDPRLVVGAPVWAKTAKFTISFAFYAPMLMWMFSLGPKRRLTTFVLNASSAILAFELALVLVQAVRGHAMHFNFSTPLDGKLYSIMASSIFVYWIIMLIGAVVLLRQRLPNRALAWSIRIGFTLTVIGFALGYLMTSPTAQQLALMEAGVPGAGATIGGHTVGAADGGPGLPLLGWSTEHGDLRIPHFVGIHALQIIPLLGLLFARRGWSQRRQLGLVIVAGLGYSGLIGLVTWQALRGQALSAPDGLTLGALAGLVGLVGLGGWLVLRRTAATVTHG